MKECTKCHLIKSLDEFGRNRTHKDGYRSECRRCRSDYDKRNYNKDYQKAYHRKQYIKHKSTIRAKNDASKKKLIEEIGKEEFYKRYKIWKKEYMKTAHYNEVQHRGHIRRQYGLSGEAYKTLLENQGGVCAICGKKEVKLNNRKTDIVNLSVDHCHITGKVRGLLCYKCNTTLGRFNDNIDLLKKAINYLKKYTQLN